MNNREKFWLYDINYLFSSLTFIPTQNMTYIERLNTLTRLLIIISFGLYIISYKYYIAVFSLGLLSIIILYQANDINKQEGFISRRSCGFDPNLRRLNSAYEITLPIQFNTFDDSKRSYMNAKYELTPLTDTDGFRQIWRSEPEMCGGYSMIPDPETNTKEEEMPIGQCNYIVRSKIDHLEGQTGLSSMRAMAEQDYTKSILDFRNGIMNEHLDRFRRERLHNCGDMRLNAFSAGSGGSI